MSSVTAETTTIQGMVTERWVGSNGRDASRVPTAKGEAVCLHNPYNFLGRVHFLFVCLFVL